MWLAGCSSRPYMPNGPLVLCALLTGFPADKVHVLHRESRNHLLSPINSSEKAFPRLRQLEIHPLTRATQGLMETIIVNEMSGILLKLLQLHTGSASYIHAYFHLLGLGCERSLLLRDWLAPKCSLCGFRRTERRW